MIHQSQLPNVPKDSVQCPYIGYGHMNTSQSLGTSVQVFKGQMNTCEHMNTINTNIDDKDKRHALLDEYRTKQPFRVSIGKSQWIPYEHFDEHYNLREILKDEIVIEFDTADLEIVVRAISQTGLNLLKAGYTFEYWEHGGKSPHLHIHNLPIAHLDDNKRATFKKLFIRKYVPLESLPYVDFSLTGVHLIALEWAFHWKGCYSIKKLIHTFTPEQYQAANNPGVLPVEGRNIGLNAQSGGFK